jgi:glutamine---fructose-6-phosphate transaminase (isomerizing)
MCGITGYVGQEDVISIIISGLKRLEYRGYDSCGIAYIKNKQLKVIKEKGRISELEKIVSKDKNINIGIGHTRWATHGAPTKENAHPHTDCKNNLALVHNGIIENYESIKQILEKEGHIFKSETDSEVLVHLIEKFYDGNLVEAVRKSLSQVVGTYGLIVLDKDKEEMVVSRKGSPLVIGLKKNEYFVSSDVSAIIEHTKDIVFLEDHEMAVINKNGYKIFEKNNLPIEKEIQKIKLSLDQIEKGNFKHFMLKEIFEQSETIKNTIAGRIDMNKLTAKLGGIEDALNLKNIDNIKRILILGCGTSWHCGMIGKYILEKYTGIPVSVEQASEFRYRDAVVDSSVLTIVISQSGETADTLSALREAKKKGSLILGVVNVVGSTISRESDFGIYTRAGVEIGVASTKAFTSQLVVLFLLVLYLGKYKGKISDLQAKQIIEAIENIPRKTQAVLKNIETIKNIAEKYKDSKNMLYLGRGVNYPLALEGALKLKEISYIHSEGIPSAEMKHGSIALIDKDMPSFFIANKDETYEKVVSNINEVKARGGKIIAITTQKNKDLENLVDDVIYVPEINESFTPFVNVIVLQLFAYYVSDFLGREIDKPRNLAKSVTVE